MSQRMCWHIFNAKFTALATKTKPYLCLAYPAPGGAVSVGKVPGLYLQLAIVLARSTIWPVILVHTLDNVFQLSIGQTNGSHTEI